MGFKAKFLLVYVYLFLKDISNCQTMIKHGESALSLYLKCQVPPEKVKLDLSKKVCLVLGISNESASISNGIAKSLSQAGAKVYVAPSQNNKSEKKWPEIEQPYRNKNVFPIQGFKDGTNEECDISTIFEHIKQQEDGKLDILINNFYDYNYLNTCKNEKPISICDQPVAWENIIHQCHGLRKQLISISLASRMMASNGSGLIVNVYPHRDIIREYLPRQIETLCTEELLSNFSNELKTHNVSLISLMVGPTNDSEIKEKFSGDAKESCELTGLAISHLASDTEIAKSQEKYSIQEAWRKNTV